MNKEQSELIDIIMIFRNYMRMLFRKWKIVVLFILCGTLFCYFRGKASYQPSYVASATFTINIRDEQKGNMEKDESFFDNEAAEQMAKTFPYILTSGVLQRKVENDLGIESVAGKISAEVMENTNFLTISVEDIDAERAYATLQSVIKNYPSVSEVIIGKISMQKLDETGIPIAPINANEVKRKTIKGGIVGGVFGFLWIGLLTFIHKTIRGEEDCPKLIYKKCLGSVPQIHAKKRSAKQEYHLNILDEYVEDKFLEAFRIIRNKVEQSAEINQLKSILVTSAISGEGKSTIAVNLALSLAQRNKKVALLDCDLRHPSDNTILKWKQNKGLGEYLKGECSLSECWIHNKNVFGNHEELFFIPGGKPLEDGSKFLSTDKMQKIIEELESKMDFVIIDAPPIALMTDAAILSKYADGVLFIVRQDYANVNCILEGMEELTQSKTYFMGCVLNGEE